MPNSFELKYNVINGVIKQETPVLASVSCFCYLIINDLK